MGSKGKRRFKTPGVVRGTTGPAGGNMMQQFEDLQNQMAQAQTALADEVVSASVGGGAVTIEMTGSQELRSIKIRPDVVDPEDVEMLQDLLVAAFSEAMAKSQQLASDRLAPLTGGLDLPGLF
jgi:DNA-binding YbaB/EbfC family protein